MLRGYNIRIGYFQPPKSVWKTLEFAYDDLPEETTDDEVKDMVYQDAKKYLIDRGIHESRIFGEVEYYSL